MIEPFSIQQAMIAMELGPTDDVVLDYLDFLTVQVPTGAAYFLHVVPKLDALQSMVDREAQGLISNYELNEDVITRMEGELQNRLTRANAVHIELDVREGNPLEELLKETNDLDADLVVIGQHTGADEHGILARNLARKIPCNALIIPDQARPQLKTILVPVDFSDNSVIALRTALAINRQLEEKARVIALNVYDMPNMSVYRVQKSRAQLKEMLEEDRREAFEAFLHSHAPEDMDDIETVLIERTHPGIPSYITDYAREESVDLIVMGAKGHSKVELLLLGSITEKVLTDNDRIPTLVVKDQE